MTCKCVYYSVKKVITASPSLMLVVSKHLKPSMVINGLSHADSILWLRSNSTLQMVIWKCIVTDVSRGGGRLLSLNNTIVIIFSNIYIHVVYIYIYIYFFFLFCFFFVDIFYYKFLSFNI